MSTVVEHSSLTPGRLGSSYRQVCAVAGLEPVPSGYGLLHLRDENGKRWTAAGSPAALDLVLAADRAKNGEEVDVSPLLFPWRRAGWPDEWIS